MFRSQFSRRILFAIATALSATYVLVDRAVSACMYAVRLAADWVGVRVRTVLEKFSELVMHRPAVKIIAAKASISRVMKRQAPRVESGWRLCPSI